MRRHSIFGKDNNAGEKLRQQEKRETKYHMNSLHIRSRSLEELGRAAEDWTGWTTLIYRGARTQHPLSARNKPISCLNIS